MQDNLEQKYGPGQYNVSWDCYPLEREPHHSPTVDSYQLGDRSSSVRMVRESSIYAFMTMRPRVSIIDLFSSFLRFGADRVEGWVSDRRLQRSMEMSMTQLSAPPTDDERFWVLYWYHAWQKSPDSIARDHLTAYLQESCYWAANKTQTHYASVSYALGDYFQIAIAQVEKVLRNFNPQQGIQLKNYANAVFYSAIKETLRQRQETDICTPWALLRKLSHKRLETALTQGGLSTPMIIQYLLAWNCFKTLYTPAATPFSTRQLERPNAEIWEAIASCYNQNREHYPAISPTQLEQWLLHCVKLARAYLYPQTYSLNAPKSDLDQEWLESLNIPVDSPLTQLIAQEDYQQQYQQQQQLCTVLKQHLQQLDVTDQTLLKLYYGQNLTQQQLATQLGLKQYTISRKLTKIRSSLLGALARWSQESLHISIASNVLKDMSVVLEEWLIAYHSL